MDLMVLPRSIRGALHANSERTALAGVLVNIAIRAPIEELVTGRNSMVAGDRRASESSDVRCDDARPHGGSKNGVKRGFFNTK